MTELTRRGAIGLTGGLMGLAACGPSDQTRSTSAPVRMDPDTRAPYRGAVAFRHGVASGDPRPDSVVLWTRVTPLGEPDRTIPVSYGVFEDEALERPVAFGLTLAEPGRDHCVKVEADGLQPGTVYYYRFIARASEGQETSPVGRTRSAPALDSAEPVRLAVISCANYPFGHFNVYREIGARDDLDAVVHLGDYMYEYGVDGYGGATGEALGRRHDPITEVVTLDDYRTRLAQYRADPDLQSAHAAAPWLCTWDDHESANNSYRTGAQNHNPEAQEGAWSDRKRAAVQAWLEWMPVRDPEPGRAREAVYRTFEFGKVATICCLETRLTGRSKEISWLAELGGLPGEEIPQAAMKVMGRVSDPERTMLGAQQEAWLSSALDASVARGAAWQVLANQVILARVKPPNFTQTLSDDQISAVENDLVSQLVSFSQLGLAWNLDAWDGFPAARERLYDAARSAGARLVTLAGDTHTAWANTLYDREKRLRGVEFGCTSVTSPGFGSYMPHVEDLGEQFERVNPEVDHHDPFGRGYTLVTLTETEVRTTFHKVSTVESREYETTRSATFTSRRDGDGMTALQRV